MKFDSLFKNVFITEQDEVAPSAEATPDAAPTDAPAPEAAPTDAAAPEAAPEGAPEETDGVPMPDNYDVEPAPVAQPTGDAGSVSNYITKLDDFADALNGVDTGSLQQMVTDMDRPGSLFQGISRETSSDIIKLAKQSRDLSEILKGFIINSAKRQRDIAAGQ